MESSFPVNEFLIINTHSESLIFLDIDECEEDTHNCDEDADCVNNPGSFACVCHFGYSFIDGVCNGNCSRFSIQQYLALLHLQ